MSAREDGSAAVFLDRDGTLNVEKNYLYRVEDWEWIPGAIEAIRKFRDHGFKVIVITNQAGIARGYYGEDDVRKLHEAVNAMLAREAAQIDAFYYCPHHPEFGGPCECRKPSPALIRQACAEWNIDPSRSVLVGDKIIDVRAALAAGVRPILVETGYGEEELSQLPEGIEHVPDVGAAATLILETAGLTGN